MKTILYNPIFINPQAYYVFPRLTRYLQPDNESTAEPANYIGTIEVKVIAYGDTTLKRTYTNTDSIDLSEFKNTWIRISLFTKVGSCVLGEWKIGNMESDLPYIDPEVLASLKAVVIVGNKTNNDSDRAIVKNLVDPDNPFVISNAAFKLNSGFGKYGVDFTSWIQTNGVIASSDKVQNSITGRFLYFNTVNKKEDVPSFKVNITLGQQSKLQYNYIKEDGTSTYIVYSESGIYTIPASYFSKYTGGNAWFGFYQIEGTSIIEQIPSFEGAFVTDGIDDLITSTKTVQEMGITNEVTVVSMIHQIGLGRRTNFICDKGSYWRCNEVANTGEGKTGIYGYSSTNISVNTPNIINNVLGDKVDYSVTGDRNDLTPSQFSVVGYIGGSTGEISYTSSVAWYWTIIANKVLTTDQINQVIAYFNLDRTLKPDILCNTIKQGITNENHAEFGDKLIDFSGNGRDIQLNNLAWKGGSGIAAKPFETIKDYTIVSDEARQKLTIYNEFSYKVKSNTPNHYWTVQSIIKDNTSYQVTIITDKDCYWINSTSFTNNEGNKESIRKEYPVKANTPTQVTICGLNEFEYPEDIEPTTAVSYVNLSYAGEVTVTFIPSCKGGLLLDGVNDFGKVTGMPIYKDYTFIIDYERISYTSEGWGGAIVSKSPKANNGAFISMMANSAGLNKQLFSFGGVTAFVKDDLSRILFWQTKYKSENTELTVGEGVDGDTLWLGTLRDNDSRFFNGAIYSLMSFPYSMSEFLIERQLKKYKLGTLYPNMVEFRPIIKANDNYKIFYTAMLPLTGDIWERINIGDYVPVGRRIAIQMSFDNEAKKLVSAVSSQLGNITIVKNSNNIGYTIFGDVLKDKSPQKISITIEQDENYVLFNPVINSNYKYISLDFFLNNYQKKINIGDYIPKDAYLRANLYLNNNVDEPAEFTFNGVSIGYSRSITVDTAFNIGHIYNYDSPQEVNITIDEYIRYEDIVQPYPVLLRFNDESGKEVSWGGKFRVGSTITRIGSAADSNLLPNIYNIFGLLLNDNQVTSSKVIVEKTMVFKAKSAYIFDNNEPKVILSPSRLRIPNSSYKILGYIPDISGHGNHGVIHNSAYTGMSGANGYTEDFTKWTLYTGVKCTDSIISLDSSFNKQDQWILFKPKGSNINQFTINIKGIPDGGNLYLRLSTDSNIKLENGINEISSYTNVTNSTGFFIGANGLNLDWSNLVIEQVGEYEGAYCLDGVDDFVTIPTVTGGKQVLMKVNWQSIAGTAILYDQRTNGGFAIFNRDYDTNENKVPAYRARNIGGNTYIDGILNEYIYASQLQNITHNIVELYDPELNIGTLNPKIGSSYLNSNYAQMSLYDFMLFDNISTDDKIKQLNEYVGIEGNTEWRKTK